MKKKLLIALVSVLLCFSACGPSDSGSLNSEGSNPTPFPSDVPLNRPANVTPASVEMTATLYADFSNGSGTAESEGLISEYEFKYFDRLTAVALADGLTELTGLDFSINKVVRIVNDGLKIDWLTGSTLLAGLDGRDQKEDFRFFDAESLNWFMLDSLSRTLKQSLAIENVYYTMDGGKTLELPDMPVTTFPSNEPYMGSAFYMTQSDSNSEDNVNGLSQDKAMILLMDALYDKITELNALVSEGNKISLVAYDQMVINEELCWTFALGTEMPEKFTAEMHYAVNPAGKIYYMDITGDYLEYTQK